MGGIVFTHRYREDDDPTNPHRKPQNEIEADAITAGWAPCNGQALAGRQYVDCNGWISPKTGSCGSLAAFIDQTEFRTILLQHRPTDLDVSERRNTSKIVDCSCGNYIDWDKAVLVHNSDPTHEKAWVNHVVKALIDVGFNDEKW